MIEAHGIVGVGAKIDEAVSVETVNSRPCGNPYVSVGVLHNVAHVLIRQHVGHTKMMAHNLSTDANDGKYYCQKGYDSTQFHDSM